MSNKTAINPNEVMKLVFTAIVGVTGYFVVTIVGQSIEESTLALEKTKVQLQLAEKLPEFQPLVKINYTNQLNENGVVDVKVFIHILSKFQIEIEKPSFSIYNLETENNIDNQNYYVNNQNQFWGTFSPNTKYLINYQVELDDSIVPEQHGISISYTMKTGAIEKEILEILYSGDKIFSGLVEKATIKKYGYGEQIYLYGKNTIWSTFEENPR